MVHLVQERATKLENLSSVPGTCVVGANPLSLLSSDLHTFTLWHDQHPQFPRANEEM